MQRRKLNRDGTSILKSKGTMERRTLPSFKEATRGSNRGEKMEGFKSRKAQIYDKKQIKRVFFGLLKIDNITLRLIFLSLIEFHFLVALMPCTFQQSMFQGLLFIENKRKIQQKTIKGESWNITALSPNPFHGLQHPLVP